MDKIKVAPELEYSDSSPSVLSEDAERADEGRRKRSRISSVLGGVMGTALAAGVTAYSPDARSDDFQFYGMQVQAEGLGQTVKIPGVDLPIDGFAKFRYNSWLGTGGLLTGIGTRIFNSENFNWSFRGGISTQTGKSPESIFGTSMSTGKGDFSGRAKLDIFASEVAVATTQVPQGPGPINPPTPQKRISIRGAGEAEGLWSPFNPDNIIQLSVGGSVKVNVDEKNTVIGWGPLVQVPFQFFTCGENKRVLWVAPFGSFQFIAQTHPEIVGGSTLGGYINTGINIFEGEKPCGASIKP